jgi:hypothetical protein
VAGLLRCSIDDPGADVRRILILVSCLCAMGLALYSCSMHAAMTTDGDGNVVEVSSLRLQSSLAGVAVAMLVAGGEVAFELRWIRSVTPGLVDSLGG